MIPKQCRLITWRGDVPQPGEFLRTHAGTLYLVLSVRPNTRPDPKSVAALQLGKLEPEDPRPQAGDRVHRFAWNGRQRKVRHR